jgi:hypothetical protein
MKTPVIFLAAALMLPQAASATTVSAALVFCGERQHATQDSTGRITLHYDPRVFSFCLGLYKYSYFLPQNRQIILTELLTVDDQNIFDMLNQ